MTKNVFKFIFLVLVAFSGKVSLAFVIPVVNGSFEADTGSDSSHGYYGSPSGWTLTGSGGAENPLFVARSGSIPSTISGKQVGWLQGTGSMFVQQVGQYDPTATYEFQYFAGAYYRTGTYQVQLLVGDSVLASYLSGAVQAGEWDSMQSLSAGPNSLLSGQLSIALKFISGYEIVWDSISLNVSNSSISVPEPTTPMLMIWVLALLALGGVRNNIQGLYRMKA